MMKLPFFRVIARSNAIREQTYLAAAAVGVSSTFGTPIGGLLFSIEVTAVYYFIYNYWKSAVSALVGAVVFYLYQGSDFLSLFYTSLPLYAYSTLRTCRHCRCRCCPGTTGHARPRGPLMPVRDGGGGGGAQSCSRSSRSASSSDWPAHCWCA